MTTEKLIETVTISLERYKELEEKEKALDSKRTIVIKDGYYSREKAYILVSENEAIREMRKEINEVKTTASANQQKAKRLEYIEDSFWFRLIKRFIKDIKYY